MTVNVKMDIRPSSYIAAVIRPQVQAHFDPRMKMALAYAQINAPVDKQGGGGRLRSAIRLYVRDDKGRFATQRSGTVVCSYELAVEVPYARFVILGTRPHLIRSTGPWSLHNPKTGAFFGQQVQHPGTKPNDFLTLSMQQAGMA